MLREQAKVFNRLSIIVDLLVVLTAFGLSFLVRRNYQPPLLPIREYVWVLLIVLPVWHYLLAKHHLFASIRRLSLFEIVTRIANVHILGGLTVAAFIFFFDRHNFSRGLFLMFLVFSFLLLGLEKVSLRLFLGLLRRKGRNFRNILIVGTREKARRFHQLISDHADWGLRMVGFVQVADHPLQTEVDGHQVLGHVNDLLEICKRHTVDEVVFCLPKNLVVDAEEYVRDLEELGVTVRMVLDFYEVVHSRTELSYFHGEIPLLTYYCKAFDAQQLFLKRALDLAGAVVGLAFTALLFPLIALAIRLDSAGPIFFAQERVGQSGRIFRCWKFRSMSVDAETLKEALLDCNEMKGAVFKIRDDPRITRVGKFLRKTSLDELPQFWNVLKGEMSLVGTRPPTPGEVSQYENWHRRRICIKPGITGLWQVSGRNGIDDFDEIVRLDLHYIDKWSLWLDIKILLKTVVVVFSRQGSF
jgi:exopolysaccharide biosynthesis polyprenyl glycosylphosphotransferase